jgi:hypothetical protein
LQGIDAYNDQRMPGFRHRRALRRVQKLHLDLDELELQVVLLHHTCPTIAAEPSTPSAVTAEPAAAPACAAAPA